MAVDTPPRQQTDEASERGLELAREAGDAYRRMVDYFIENVATSGARQRAGDYVIGVAVEEAEPLWQMLGGKLELREPMTDANAHLEVVVMDGADGRFVPALDVNVTLIDGSGSTLGTYELPFLWHPTMYHYGRSVHVPDAGTYTLRVHVEAPRFPRHDKVNGRRYADAVTCEFPDIRIEPGRKA